MRGGEIPGWVCCDEDGTPLWKSGCDFEHSLTPLQWRRPLLPAALGFALLRRHEPGPLVTSLGRGWLDTWTGIGAIAGGMAEQRYDVSLTRYDERGVSA